LIRKFADIWHALSTDEPTRIRDRAIVALLSHGLRASELSVLNVHHWNGKDQLFIARKREQNVSEVPLSRGSAKTTPGSMAVAAQEGEVFEPTPDSPMFCAKRPKHRGERLWGI